MRHQIGAAHDRAQYTTATGRRGSAGGRAILLGVVALILALTLALGAVGGFYTPTRPRNYLADSATPSSAPVSFSAARAGARADPR